MSCCRGGPTTRVCVGPCGIYPGPRVMARGSWSQAAWWDNIALHNNTLCSVKNGGATLRHCLAARGITATHHLHMAQLLISPCINTCTSCLRLNCLHLPKETDNRCTHTHTHICVYIHNLYLSCKGTCILQDCNHSNLYPITRNIERRITRSSRSG